MSEKPIILTRKVQLLVNSDDKAVIGEVFKTLYQWRYICFRAANYIFTHLFIQHQIKELFYLRDDVKVKLADSVKDSNGVLTSSQLNTIYRMLSARFKGDIPMHIIATLSMTLAKHFNNEKNDYLKGEKSVRNYKRDIPIPFGSKDITHLQSIQNGREYSFQLFKIPFRTYLGRDQIYKRPLFERLLKGELILHNSSIQIDKSKIYLLAAFEVEKEVNDLDISIVAEAHLSIDYPIILHIGKVRHTIGSKEEFLHRRLAIQAARSRSQKAATFNRGQHGRRRKLKPLEEFREKERNYVQQRLHLYSRRLVDLCIQHRAGSLILVGQAEKEAATAGDELVLRNWSYYSLKQKIEYKANKAGVMLITE
jgi:IS605 OrfB family transposase